jgi:hypothetical protein
MRDTMSRVRTRSAGDSGVTLIILGANYVRTLHTLVYELLAGRCLVLLVDECGSSQVCPLHFEPAPLVKRTERAIMCAEAWQRVAEAREAAREAARRGGAQVPHTGMPHTQDNHDVSTPYDVQLCHFVGQGNGELPTPPQRRADGGEFSNFGRSAQPLREALVQHVDERTVAPDIIPKEVRARSAMLRAGHAGQVRWIAELRDDNNSPERANVLAWFAGVLDEKPWLATVRVGLQRHEVMQKVAAAAPADAEFVNVERDSINYWRSRRFMRPIVSMTTAALKRKRAQWLRRARCNSCADKFKRCAECLEGKVLRETKLACIDEGLCETHDASTVFVAFDRAGEVWRAKECRFDNNRHVFHRDCGSTCLFLVTIRAEYELRQRPAPFRYSKTPHISRWKTRARGAHSSF